MKQWIGLILVCALFSTCTWRTKIKVMEQTSSTFRHEFRGMKVITIAPPASTLPLAIAGLDWKETFRKRLQERFAERNAFAVVDSSSIASDLEKFLGAGDTRPKEEKILVQGIGAEGVVYVEFTGPAKWGACEHTQSKSIQTQLCFGHSCGEITHSVLDFKKSMAVRALTIPFRAFVVDTRNGVVGRMSGIAGELSSTYSGECLSDDLVMSYLLSSYATRIAEHYSPAVRTDEVEVEFESSVEGCPDTVRAEASSLLKTGIGFAMNNDFRKAREPWLTAMNVCKEKSASAHWNLGIYFWVVGDLNAADTHFKKALTLGGDRFRENALHQRALDRLRAARAKA